MFGKKKAKKAPQSAPASTEKQAVKTKAKKKKSGMSVIFRESVLETVMEDFRANEQFIHVENGETKYVGLVLHAKEIGGLDKKSKKDEAKGSIIECINSGRIKTFINDDLLEEECLVIIPELKTLNAMDEFTLLTTAKYELCFVDVHGEPELLGQYMTYDEVVDIIVEEGHIDDVLGGDESSEEDGEDADDILSDEVVEKPAEDFDSIESDEDIDYLDEDDDIPMLDEPELGDELDEIPDMTEKSEPEPQTYQPQYTEPVQDMSQEQEVPEQEMENEIPSDWTEAAIVRRFYADDLGLEVSVAPFDAQFMQDNVFVPFPEDRPEGFINDQLNEMSRQANADLYKMHEENLFLMRERYFRLISMQCDRIRKDLDINDTNTLYGQMKQQLVSDHEEGVQTIDMQVAAQKEELEAAWKQKLQEVGMDAAREAQHKYRERYQPAHEQKIYDIVNAVKANIEAEYQYGISDLNERRRYEASALLDLAISETLDEISHMYEGALAEERTRYREYAEDLRNFQNDYMKSEIARTEVLGEELRQTEKADKILAEQTQKMNAMQQEHANKRAELQREIEQIRQENENRLRNVKEDAQRDVNLAKRDAEDMHKKYDELFEKYKNLDAAKNDEYRARMAELKDEIEALNDRNDHLVEVHKKSNLIATFFVIASIIAAIAIGYIGGEYVNSSRYVKQQINAMQQMYDAEDASGE